MKTNFKKSVCAFITLFTLTTSGSLFAKDKTAGEKVDQAIDKTEKAVESAYDKAKEIANDAKEVANDAKDKAKEKAHEGLDKL